MLPAVNQMFQEWHASALWLRSQAKLGAAIVSTTCRLSSCQLRRAPKIESLFTNLSFSGSILGSWRILSEEQLIWPWLKRTNPSLRFWTL